MEPKTELQKNAIADARRKELETFQRALDIQWLNSRMEDGRMGRCLALIQKEAEMEKDFQERTDHAAIVNARAEKEIAFGIEVAKIRHDEVCELQRRHYLRERDPSLKTLAKKLQAGYVCRDLRQQIANNEYRRLQLKAEEDHANRILLESLYNDQEAKHHEESEKKKRSSQYCQELQQQLVNRQLQKQCQYEDTLIEKKMLDDIMRTIADEDQRELKQKREQMEKMRREMVTSQQARAAWRGKQRLVAVGEERELEAQRRAAADRSAAITAMSVLLERAGDILASCLHAVTLQRLVAVGEERQLEAQRRAADRSAAIIAERQRKMKMKEELTNKICEKIMADEAERQYRIDIIKQLQEQEYLEKNCQDDIASSLKVERVRKDTKDALTAQMDTKKRLEAEQKIRDSEFRKQTEAKIAADNDKEAEKQRKLKEKARQYSLELRKQIEDNAVKRRNQREEEEARAKYVWDWDKAWREEVSEERKKIVEEHVPHLLGYLQAGVIKKEDLPAVREGVAKHEELKTLDIDSLAVSSRIKRHPKCNAQCRIIREY